MVLGSRRVTSPSPDTGITASGGGRVGVLLP